MHKWINKLLWNLKRYRAITRKNRRMYRAYKLWLRADIDSISARAGHLLFRYASSIYMKASPIKARGVQCASLKKVAGSDEQSTCIQIEFEDGFEFVLVFSCPYYQLDSWILPLPTVFVFKKLD